MIKYFCDRCKKEISPGNFSVIKINTLKKIEPCYPPHTSPIIVYENLILCHLCSMRFNKLLEKFTGEMKND